MTTDYDAIAEGYQRAKLQPWREEVEAFTFLELIGDVAGKSVVDLACGEGFYTRRLKDRGAARVRGRRSVAGDDRPGTGRGSPLPARDRIPCRRCRGDLDRVASSTSWSRPTCSITPGMSGS